MSWNQASSGLAPGAREDDAAGAQICHCVHKCSFLEQDNKAFLPSQTTSKEDLPRVWGQIIVCLAITRVFGLIGEVESILGQFYLKMCCIMATGIWMGHHDRIPPQ